MKRCWSLLELLVDIFATGWARLQLLIDSLVTGRMDVIQAMWTYGDSFISVRIDPCSVGLM